MSILINTAAVPPPLTAPPAGEALPQAPAPVSPPADSPVRLEADRPLLKALDIFSHQLEKGDEKIQKSFNHLAHSLEKMFGEAQDVDRETAEEELKEGGLRRVGKDLGKLFKGLGIPSQLAKQFAHGITAAIKQDDVEQIDFSLTATRAFNLDIQQTRQGYLATGDGAGGAPSVSSSFQLTAIQIRSVDISLNLNSGEFSYRSTSFDSLSISSSTTVGPAELPADAVDRSVPAAENSPAATRDDTGNAPPVAADQSAPAPGDNADPLAVVQSDNILLQISRFVQQSSIMQLSPQLVADPAEGEQQLSGFDLLQSLVDKMAEFTEGRRNLFESQLEVRNLRVEKDDDEDEHLRFTFDALVPVGLTAVDESGRSSTVYPRADGSLAQVAEGPVRVRV